MKSHFLLLLFVCCANIQIINAQIYINEVCSRNESTLIDDHGDYPDWIECYNSGESSVNLSNYHLSDNPDNPLKWNFPPVIINAHEYLIVYASGQAATTPLIHCNFKLSKYGETILLSDTSGDLIESFSLPPLAKDQSYGRQPDGSDHFFYFEEPTPGISNNESQAQMRLSAPDFSLKAYFFESPVSLILEAETPAADIHFTTDGSIPDENSALYVSPISIDSTVCIRAICTGDGFLPSKITTHTYFIHTKHQLPVVALSSDPDNFWGWEQGILIDGPGIDSIWPFYGANYWLDIEIPVHFEFFDESGDFKTAYDLGAKIHGGRGGRVHPQKPLRLLAKKKYGTEVMDFPFFKDRENTKYKRLILRNSSGDFNVSHFRDGMLQRLIIKDGLDIDGLAYQPVVVYLDGQYYGVLNLREKADEYYLKYRFGVNPDEVDLLEEDTMILRGNFDLFHAHYDFVTHHDMGVSSDYAQAASYFDIESMVDYFIVETATCNTDSYANNIKYWRQKKADAKWRYILFDLDSALGRNGWNNQNVDVFGHKMVEYQDTNFHINIFKSLLANEGFKFYFLNRYADLLNTTFRAENLRQEIINSRDQIAEEMVRHFLLYTWPGYDVWWNNRLNTLFEFAAERPDYARQYLQEYFQFKGMVDLTLKTFPEGAGSIKINTITPDLPWDGIYFNGIPVNLTIEANDGFKFSHWQSIHTIKDKDTHPSILYNFEEDDEIVAYFDAKYTGLELKIYPNNTRAGAAIKLSYVLDQITDIEIQLLDTNGKLVQKWAKIHKNGGKNTTEVSLNGDLPQGMYFIWVKTNTQKEGKQIFIY